MGTVYNKYSGCRESVPTAITVGRLRRKGLEAGKMEFTFFIDLAIFLGQVYVLRVSETR